MTSSPATKRAKSSDEDKKDSLEQWFQKASSDEVLDRWFPSGGNMGSGRFNMGGDWVGEFDGPTDWDDFQDCLDRIPDLAKTKEWGIPIIFHCCHVSDPPVPPAVMRKLITANPALLRARRHDVYDPNFFGDNGLEPRGDLNVLQVYLEAPSWVIDFWKVEFEVAKVLIDAEPKRLFHKDDQGETTLEAFLWRFPEKGKALVLELQKSASAEESKQIEEALRAREEAEKEDEEEEDNEEDEE